MIGYEGTEKVNPKMDKILKIILLILFIIIIFLLIEN